MEDGMVDVVPQGDLAFAQAPVVSNYTPKEVDDHIDVLEFGSNGQLYLATSSLNKRSWTGDLWWFQKPEDAPKASEACTGYRIDSGIAQVKAINKTQLVLGLDSGALQLVRICTTTHETKDTLHHFFEMHPTYCEHDDRITDVDVWRNADDSTSSPAIEGAASTPNLVISGCMDGRVIVWDKNMGISYNLHPAHPAGVISVSCNQEDNHIFATAGLEGKIKVWNIRNVKSCRTVYTDEMEPPAVISWVPGRKNTLLVASKTGAVFLLNTETKTVSAHLSVMDREIRNLSWSSARPQLCAVAGDDVTVHVIKVEEELISNHYTNDQSHKDFVRGLAWHPSSDVLWSSGWDNRVCQHQVP
eukprot:TRINITY_DN29865_c0_g1_i6.p1 TRINITY_DN29865_c0_g1~~TRINITY_DN29865_c0_g1_i6.p1  ORF type:complete len:358 (+),score=51.91 TRINITY_DN29865_c0_g1_i6:56-1129(+)